MTEIKFQTWLPDQQDFNNPGLEVCTNAIPDSDGYQPAREAEAGGATISGRIIGAASAYIEDGSAVTFCATTADLYVIRNNTVTASSLGLSLADTDVVTFEQFNTGLYASTKNGDTWAISDVETSTTFALSAGTPPKANAMGRIADFLVMGDLIDIDSTDAPYRIRWSRFNDPQGTWGTDIAAQAGAIDLDAAYGPVTAVTGGSYGMVFQRQGISRLTYTGGANVFRLDTFEKSRGCVAPSSAVQIGERTYYLAHDGFFVTDGTTPAPISTGRMWKWFIGRINQAQLPAVVGAVDFERRCIVWLFADAGSDDFTSQIWFYWETGEWGFVDQPLQWAVQGAKSGLTLEEVGDLYPNIDTMALSLDSPTFQPSGRNLRVFEGGNMSTLTGPTLAATFTTGDIQPIPKRRSFITEVHPLVLADRVDVRLGCKDRMTQEITYTDRVAMGSIGFAPLNHDARYFRVSIEIPAGEEWGDAYGFQITASDSGAV